MIFLENIKEREENWNLSRIYYR